MNDVFLNTVGMIAVWDDTDPTTNVYGWRGMFFLAFVVPPLGGKDFAGR